MLDLFTIIGISIIIFITRFVNLLNIPIFTDEAIYIRWAQIGLSDPAQRFISLTDGKQPLLTWLMYPMLKMFSDPLFAGRMISVLSGVLTGIGLYFVAKELFDRKVAIFSVVLYLFSPFTIIYDRLVLMDSLLASLGIWSLYLEILLVRKIKLDIALLLGITIGLGLLTKSSAFFFIYLMPFSLILFDFKSKNQRLRLYKWIGLIFIATIYSQIIYNMLRLSPWFYIIELKNHSFVLTLAEFLQSPFKIYWGNLRGLTEILIHYLSVPVFIVLIIGILWMILRREKPIFLLFSWFIFPYLTLAFFGKIIFPRFILFMVSPLFIIIALVLTRFFSFAYQKYKILLIFLPVILFYSFFQTMLVIFSPVNLDIPRVDRNQLFDDWPSGYGVTEVVNYLENQAINQKIVVGTEGTFGLNPAVYEIYLGLNKNVEIEGFWPVSEIPSKMLVKAKSYPTYFIFKEKQNIPQDWPLNLIAKYQRGKSKSFLLFYRVDPSKIKEN